MYSRELQGGSDWWRGEGAHRAVTPIPTVVCLGRGGTEPGPFILPWTRRKRGRWRRDTEWGAEKVKLGSSPTVLPKLHKSQRRRFNFVDVRGVDPESLSLQLHVSSCVQALNHWIKHLLLNSYHTQMTCVRNSRRWCSSAAHIVTFTEVIPHFSPSCEGESRGRKAEQTDASPANAAHYKHSVLTEGGTHRCVFPINSSLTQF